MTQSCCPLDFDPIPSIIQHSGYNWTLNTSITFASSYLLLIETLIIISNLLTWLNLLCWIKRMLVVQQRVGGLDLPFVICTKRVLFNHIFYTNLWEYLSWYVNLATDIANVNHIALSFLFLMSFSGKPWISPHHPKSPIMILNNLK